jgi:hypothetical protein
MRDGGFPLIHEELWQRTAEDIVEGEILDAEFERLFFHYKYSLLHSFFCYYSLLIV